MDLVAAPHYDLIVHETSLAPCTTIRLDFQRSAEAILGKRAFFLSRERRK